MTKSRLSSHRERVRLLASDVQCRFKTDVRSCAIISGYSGDYLKYERCYHGDDIIADLISHSYYYYREIKTRCREIRKFQQFFVEASW